MYVHKYKTEVKREEKGKRGAMKTSHDRKGTVGDEQRWKEASEQKRRYTQGPLSSLGFCLFFHSISGQDLLHKLNDPAENQNLCPMSTLHRRFLVGSKNRVHAPGIPALCRPVQKTGSLRPQ